MTRAMRRMRKYLIVVACIALIAGVAIGGTIAWLQDGTTPVVNTFTPTDLEIDLTEDMNAKSDPTLEKNDIWKAQLIPDKVWPKNPTVTVDCTTTNVDIYLFVKFEKTENIESYLEFDFTLDDENSGWSLVNGTTDVWYTTVSANTTAFSKALLKDNPELCEEMEAKIMQAIADKE